MIPFDTICGAILDNTRRYKRASGKRRRAGPFSDRPFLHQLVRGVRWQSIANELNRLLQVFFFLRRTVKCKHHREILSLPGFHQHKQECVPGRERVPVQRLRRLGATNRSHTCFSVSPLEGCILEAHNNSSATPISVAPPTDVFLLIQF